MVGKTTTAHRLQNTLYVRGIQSQRKQRGNNLLSSSSPHAGGGYRMEATTSLSLSLSVSLARSVQLTFSTISYNHTRNVCPKSYLYIYDFRVFYINVHSNRLDRSGPVLSTAGSLHLPSGGTCFPTLWTRKGKSFFSYGKKCPCLQW